MSAVFSVRIALLLPVGGNPALGSRASKGLIVSIPGAVFHTHTALFPVMFARSVPAILRTTDSSRVDFANVPILQSHPSVFLHAIGPDGNAYAVLFQAQDLGTKSFGRVVIGNKDPAYTTDALDLVRAPSPLTTR